MQITLNKGDEFKFNGKKMTVLVSDTLDVAIEQKPEAVEAVEAKVEKPKATKPEAKKATKASPKKK